MRIRTASQHVVIRRKPEFKFSYNRVSRVSSQSVSARTGTLENSVTAAMFFVSNYSRNRGTCCSPQLSSSSLPDRSKRLYFCQWQAAFPFARLSCLGSLFGLAFLLDHRDSLEEEGFLYLHLYERNESHFRKHGGRYYYVWIFDFVGKNELDLDGKHPYTQQSQ